MASSTIGALNVEITADSTSLAKSLASAATSVKSFGKNAEGVKSVELKANADNLDKALASAKSALKSFESDAENIKDADIDADTGDLKKRIAEATQSILDFERNTSNVKDVAFDADTTKLGKALVDAESAVKAFKFDVEDVEFNANTSELEKRLAEAEASIAEFESNAENVKTVNIKVSTDELNKGLSDAEKSIKVFEETAEKATAKAKNMTLAIAGTGAALAALAVQAATSAREIINLSRISSASVEEFQKMAFASRQYGVDQDKLGNILKDVNDRVGDFITTGAGPMVDFFEKIGPLVGVTIDDFKSLSGPQALQLFQSSLEKANVSQAEMTFYLESMASDLTTLQPLLANNGKLLKESAKEADNLGVALSAVDLAKLEQLDRSMAKTVAVIGAVSGQLVANLAPSIDTAANSIQDLAKNIDSIANAVQIVSVVFAGKYVGAISAAVVAQIRLATAQVATLTTTTRLANGIGGYTVVTAAASRSTMALSASTRALGASMAFLGGPVGVVVIAALALATFVDWESKSEKQSKQSAKALDDLSASLGLLTEQQLKASKIDLAKQSADITEKIKAQKAEVEKLAEADKKAASGSGFASAGTFAKLKRAEAELSHLNDQLKNIAGTQAKIADLEKINPEKKDVKTSVGFAFDKSSKDELIKAMGDFGKTAIQLENEQHTKRIAQVNNMSAAELTAIGGKHAALSQLEKMHSANIKSIRDSDSFLSDLSGLMVSQSDLEKQRYKVSIDNLNNYTKSELEALGGKNAVVEALTLDHNKRMGEIQRGGDVDSFLSGIRELTKTEADLETERFNASLERLNEYGAKELEAVGGKNAAVEAMTAEHLERMKEIESAATGEGVDGLDPVMKYEAETVGLLEAMGIRYDSQAEATLASNLRQQEILDAALAAETISKEQHADKMIDLKQQQEETQRKILVDNLQQGFQAMASNSKKVDKAMRAAAVVQAVIKGKQAAVDAWQAGMSTGGPYAPAVAAAYAAASIARTASMISSIKSGGSSSGGGSGGGSVATASSAGQQTEPQEQQEARRNVTINLTGESSFSTEQVRGLIESINEQVGDGVKLATN